MTGTSSEDAAQAGEAATERSGIVRAVEAGRRALRSVENVLAVGAGLFAVAIMVFTTRDAIGRYLVGAPVSGTYETVERLFMVGLVFFAAARTERIGRNVSVRLLVDRVSTRAGAAMRLIPMLAMAGLWGFIAWTSWFRGLERWDTMVITTMVPMPRGLPWLVVAIGTAVLAVRIVVTSIGEVIAPAEFEELAYAKKDVAE